ncbi:cupin domain-containing protein [Cohnella pontilimi]|uniref:Cupin domain-containing protein n=1 Tax=Cohnella pontilimi TaxID=2564100 RepID=A0A4U0FFU6_9BACL|nr:cupin domain-containing protein [Cohnella pontilimi]TJY43856.1 cupin domain-containing protein [Cohnella pontilimi]
MSSIPFSRQVSEDNSFLFLGNKVSLLVLGEETQGQYAIIQTEERKGFEPPPHVHTREDENFYVLEGEVTYFIADQVIRATPGTYVHAPRGIEHTFKLNTDLAKVLVSVYPSGFEKFVRELSIPVPDQMPSALEGPPSPEEVQRLISIAKKYGIEMNMG